LEQKIRTCAACAEKIVGEVQGLRNKNQELGDQNLQLEAKIDKYLEAVAMQEKVFQAQKDGGEAANRGASLEDNPFDKDADESGAWSYGWLIADVMRQVAKAQAVMAWSLSMLAVVHDLDRGGAGGDEIAAKIATIVEKMAPYIPENEEQEEQATPA
jgi:hypothetical protein